MIANAANGFWVSFADDCRAIDGKASMGIKAVRDMLGSVDPVLLGSLADETRRYLPAVLSEMESLHDAIRRDHAAVTRAAILFAYATPNASLNHSLGTAVALRGFDPRSFADGDYVSRLVRELPTNAYIKSRRDTFCAPLPGDMAIRLHASWRMLANPESVTLGGLESVPKVGKKVARMAFAIANPSARIFTVDRWHCRQLLALSGRPYNVDVSSWDTAYALIESFFTQWADDHFPGIPMWAVQWACWNVCVSQHRPHSAIWDGI